VTDEPITQRDLMNAVQDATLATQITTVVRDIAELKTGVTRDIAELRSERRAWQDSHEAAHREDEKTRSAQRSADLAARTTDRRFLVTTIISILGLLAVMLGLLISILPKIH
jgi:hypothetical protein